jgi:plastocyanin
MRHLLPLIFALLTASLTAAQTTHTVSVGPNGGGNSFDPAELTVELGDTVLWVWVNGYHNVVSFHNVFDSGSATTPPNTYQVVFDQALLNSAANLGLAGTSFDYYCGPHLAGGMVANVTVKLPGRPLLEVSDLQAGGATTVNVSDATPGKPVGLAYSLTGQGPTSLMTGTCGLVSADLSGPINIATIQDADAAGSMSFTTNVPPATVGMFVYLQAMDMGTCKLSNSGAWRIH